MVGFGTSDFMFTFGRLEVGLLNEIGDAIAELEDDTHGCATSDYDFVAFGLLGLLAFASSCCLVVELFVARTDLCCCRKLVQQCDCSFIVVGSNAWLCGSR